MTNLPGNLKESMMKDHRPLLPGETARRVSGDGTAKILLEMEDGETVEMVLIPEGMRTTLCFSTQAGCPIGCLFCRTGQGGLARNLDAAEIVAQVILARRIAGEEGGKLDNLVIMGMGEPLLNFEAVTKALEIITAGWGMGITQRRITLSTSGVVPRLAELRRRFPALNLAVSLNAPDDDLRRRLMPGTRRWPLSLLMKELSRLPGKSRHPVTLEYVLIEGLNDGPSQALALSGLLGGRKMQVNLIPCNRVPGSAYGPPPAGTISDFMRILSENGVKVMIRKSRGEDIEAACGQLRAARR